MTIEEMNHDTSLDGVFTVEVGSAGAYYGVRIMDCWTRYLYRMAYCVTLTTVGDKLAGG